MKKDRKLRQAITITWRGSRGRWSARITATATRGRESLRVTNPLPLYADGGMLKALLDALATDAEWAEFIARGEE
jgi:hypothetical protein